MLSTVEKDSVGMHVIFFRSTHPQLQDETMCTWIPKVCIIRVSYRNDNGHRQPKIWGCGRQQFGYNLEA